ncbi:permease prefix domain 1-containing protein [Paenibacillus turicensis]|uniref:permease prefix domain 1-containing protein n=1 Tax=Paenibacillus turicensis TaxID=160487 RepID=UPI003D2B0B72
MDFRSYLEQIFKRSLLSKQERVDMSEEMAAHLYLSKDHYINRGYSDENATKKALESFGDPISIRKNLTQQTFGFSSNIIIRLIYSSGLLFIFSILFALVARYYNVHNRIIELFPIVLITVHALSIGLLFTRKNVDRWCLLTTPFLFGMGYLQAYSDPFYKLLEKMTGIDSFAMFQKLFFSGTYDYAGRISFMFIGGYFLLFHCLIIFLLSRNIYISIMPFILSIVYTLSHMVIIGSYYKFFGEDFNSKVTRGYRIFIKGNYQRFTDIIIKLAFCILLFFVLTLIKKYRFRKKIRTT